MNSKVYCRTSFVDDLRIDHRTFDKKADRDLNQLKALDALADHGTLSKAAEALGVTQPAVSIKLRNQQRQYGVKLFWRWGRVEFSFFGTAR